MSELAATAKALVAPGKGILAADESEGTIAKRFAAVGVESTEEHRRAYRELLFTTAGAAEVISGVILFDETIRQRSADGTPFPELLERQGIIPGIKVDRGAKPLALCPGETVTEGLDGLRARFEHYRALGARFAKWRAVISIGPELPSETGLSVNAHALARYAALAQEAGLVPIVEPEVLMDGEHTIARSFDVSSRMQRAVFDGARRAARLLRGDAAEAEHGALGVQLPRAGRGRGGRRGDLEVPAARGALRAARDRLPLRRPERPRRDRASERDQPSPPAASRGSSRSRTAARCSRPRWSAGAGSPATSPPRRPPICTGRA